MDCFINGSLFEMKLPEEDTELFYKLHKALLFYTNQRKGKVRDVTTVEEFLQLPAEEIIKVREALYEHPELINAFVEDNPSNFSQDELNIVRSWNNYLQGEFFLLRHLKKYAIFLDNRTPPKAYGVLALQSDFFEGVDKKPPIYLKAVLLPFKGQITYDGLLESYNVTFGPGIRRDLNELYQEAKARYGIITALPFEEKEESDEERLKLYLRNKSLQLKYEGTINELIKKDPRLLTVYHQEMGKGHARTFGRRLSTIGLRNAWFAILEGEVVAGGSTRAEVEQILDKIVPTGKRDFCYVFHLKGK